jgi:hypothetical protein
MGWKVLLGAATSLVTLVAMPASGHNVQRHVATCLRAASPPGGCDASRLKVEFSGKLTPHELLGGRFAPVALTIGGTIGTERGGHPWALREAMVTLDRGLKIDTSGLAACPRRRLERLDAAEARKACRKAIVGHGVALVGVASTGSALRMPLMLFNGGTSEGVTRLFVYSSAEAAGGPLVAVARIRHREEGLKATWRLPRILDGDGSLLGFHLKVTRGFAASGRRHSYLSARCPNGLFRVSIPKLTFVNEAHTPGVPPRTLLKGGLVVPCGGNAESRDG